MTSIVDLKKSYNNRPQQFVKYLSRKHEIVVLSINDFWKGKHENGISLDTEFKNVLDNVEYHYLTEKRISPILQEILFGRRMKKLLKNNFDVHLNYNSLISGYAASNKLKTVFDLADDLVAMIRNSPQIPSMLRPIGGILGNMYLRKNIDRASKITLTTRVLERTCKVPDEKAEIVPNGVDTTAFRYHHDAKEELGLSGFVLGYIGVLREWVDLEPVFRAMKALGKEISLLVVGREGKLWENIALANEHGLSGRVIFSGTIPYSKVPKYISAMDVCLIPFKLNAISQGALPLKLFEYMACEKPVISVEMPAIRAIVGDAILYTSNDAGYVDRIATLYENEDLRIKMGREGRKIVEKEYDWNRILTKLENALCETVDSR